MARVAVRPKRSVPHEGIFPRADGCHVIPAKLVPGLTGDRGSRIDGTLLRESRFDEVSDNVQGDAPWDDVTPLRGLGYGGVPAPRGFALGWDPEPLRGRGGSSAKTVNGLRRGTDRLGLDRSIRSCEEIPTSRVHRSCGSRRDGR